MTDDGTQACVDHVRDIVRRLMRHQIDISDLVLTKSLKSLDVDKAGKDGAYKSALQPQLTVAKQVNSRTDMGELSYHVGDRVPYVYIEGGSSHRHSLLTAHPDSVVKDGRSVDAVYYIDNLLREPVLDILSVVIDKQHAKNLFDISTFKHELAARQKRILQNPDTPATREHKRQKIAEDESAKKAFVQRFFQTKP